MNKLYGALTQKTKMYVYEILDLFQCFSTIV